MTLDDIKVAVETLQLQVASLQKLLCDNCWNWNSNVCDLCMNCEEFQINEDQRASDRKETT